MKSLLNKQTLIIDDHKRGSKEIKNWDDDSIDIHIDKTTKTMFNGSKQNLRIKIPINSERPITISARRKVKKNKEYSIPNKLKKEIQKAFSNKEKRGAFITDLKLTLENYESTLNSEEKAIAAITRISKHFDLKWDNKTIKTYVNDDLIKYTRSYKDSNKKMYFITLDRQRIVLGDIDSYSRHEVRIKKKN